MSEDDRYTDEVVDFLQSLRISEGDSFEVSEDELLSNLRSVSTRLKDEESVTLYSIVPPPFYGENISTFFVEDIDCLTDKIQDFDHQDLRDDTYVLDNGVQLVEDSLEESYAEGKLPEDIDNIEFYCPTHSSFEEKIAEDLYGDQG